MPQLLALTIQQEKPELESEKTRLLQQEEDKKIQLAQLEESLLEVRMQMFDTVDMQKKGTWCFDGTQLYAILPTIYLF